MGEMPMRIVRASVQQCAQDIRQRPPTRFRRYPIPRSEQEPAPCSAQAVLSRARMTVHELFKSTHCLTQESDIAAYGQLRNGLLSCARIPLPSDPILSRRCKAAP